MVFDSITDMSIDEIEEMFEFIDTSANIELLSGNNTTYEKYQKALRYMRAAFVRDNFRSLGASYRYYGKQTWRENQFFSDNTWVSDRFGIAIRKFQNRYYAVKVLDLQAAWDGVLITESPDDFPMHVFPKDYICSYYPEIAAMKAHIRGVKLEEDLEEALEESD